MRAHQCFRSGLEDGAGLEKRLWMIVEPAAGDDCGQSESRQHYAGSTMIYIPTSLDQPVGAAFSVQAGGKATAASSTFASSRRRPQSIVTTIRKRGLPAIIFV